MTGVLLECMRSYFLLLSGPLELLYQPTKEIESFSRRIRAVVALFAIQSSLALEKQGCFPIVTEALLHGNSFTLGPWGSGICPRVVVSQFHFWLLKANTS